LSLFLHATHSPFYWRILKKLFSGFKNPFKKIPETRKLENIHEKHFENGKMRLENQTKLKMPFKNSILVYTL